MFVRDAFPLSLSSFISPSFLITCNTHRDAHHQSHGVLQEFHTMMHTEIVQAVTRGCRESQKRIFSLQRARANARSCTHGVQNVPARHCLQHCKLGCRHCHGGHSDYHERMMTHMQACKHDWSRRETMNLIPTSTMTPRIYPLFEAQVQIPGQGVCV